jgi:HEAT repeat protein
MRFSIAMLPNPFSFQEIIRCLSDYDHPFPARFLQYFSDLSNEYLALFASAWQELNNTRKLALLEDLEDLSDRDTLMDFSGIGKTTLNDPDAQVRETALRLLWETEDKSLIPVLINILCTDVCGKVRASAASVMGHYVFLGETEEISNELKVKVEDGLLKAYHSDTDKLVKRRALESLGYSGREEIHDLIHIASSSGDVEWLASALYAISHSADSGWTELVLKYLTHTDELVREEAVRAAGELGLEEAREKLVESLDDEDDDEVKAAIIWTLSQIGGAGVRELIIKQAEQTQDEEFLDFIEDALDNLNFTEELAQLNLIELDDISDED